MFDHHLKDREFENGVISGLAVLGLSTSEGDGSEWMPAINYTPILAGIITTVRAVVVWRAWRVRARQIRRLIREGRTQSLAQQEAPSVYSGVREIVDRFMTLT